ncbi:MAG: NAD(P)H-hydrate epimerase [Coriobacteriia bacterium]|nr:NAD(P)H-hydrate epimerase [Coriobacteriia bacterium]
MDRLLKEYAAIFEHTHEFEPPTLDVPDVVALEQAIAAAGTPLSELMDRAGTAVARRVQLVLDEVTGSGYPTWADDRGGRTRRVQRADDALVAILCGNGNNGGDGWVAAALLAQAGVPVCVFTAKMPESLKAQPACDAAIAAMGVLEDLGARVMEPRLELLDDAGGCVHAPVVVLDDGTVEGGDAFARRIIGQAHIVVDAIMGTGFSGTPRAPFSRWIAASNRSRENHACVAVDVPTGVSAQTGESSDPHFLADETITMMARKPGLTASECGRVHVAPLSYLEPFIG